LQGNVAGATWETLVDQKQMICNISDQELEEHPQNNGLQFSPPDIRDHNFLPSPRHMPYNSDALQLHASMGFEGLPQILQPRVTPSMMVTDNTTRLPEPYNCHLPGEDCSFLSSSTTPAKSTSSHRVPKEDRPIGKASEVRVASSSTVPTYFGNGDEPFIFPDD
jgi:hypothetical protein